MDKTETNIFERATRLGLVFPTSRGDLVIHDLWNMPLTGDRLPTLDGLAMALDRKVREQEGVTSFVNPAKAQDERLQLSLELVKYIIAKRLAEAKVVEDAQAKRIRVNRIRELLAERDAEADKSKPKVELEAELNALLEAA